MISYIASTKADASHKARGTHAVKKGVLDFYRMNGNPKMSISHEAAEIDRLYLPKTGEPTHATICEWISAYRKKIARSSQAPILLPPEAPAGRLISPKPPRRS